MLHIYYVGKISSFSIWIFLLFDCSSFQALREALHRTLLWQIFDSFCRPNTVFRISPIIRPAIHLAAVDKHLPWLYPFVFCHGLCIPYSSSPEDQTEQDLQRQRSVEVAQLYRQRRHISQDDTLSISSSISELDLAQQQQEERRVSSFKFL